MPRIAITANHITITGPEQLADAIRAVTLNREHADQDDDGDRARRRGRKSGVATLSPSTAPSTVIAGVIMPSPYSSAAPKMPIRTRIGHFGAPSFPLRQERGQREDPAFALVVGAHDDGDVLDGDDDQQRIDDQRQHAEDVRFGGRHGVRAEEALAHRVEWAGPDVAVDDADRGQGERNQRPRRTGTRQESSTRHNYRRQSQGARDPIRCPIV